MHRVRVGMNGWVATTFERTLIHVVQAGGFGNPIRVLDLTKRRWDSVPYATSSLRSGRRHSRPCEAYDVIVLECAHVSIKKQIPTSCWQSTRNDVGQVPLFMRGRGGRGGEREGEREALLFDCLFYLPHLS